MRDPPLWQALPFPDFASPPGPPLNLPGISPLVSGVRLTSMGPLYAYPDKGIFLSFEGFSLKLFQNWSDQKVRTSV